jgi:hypothetical protein
MKLKREPVKSSIQKRIANLACPLRDVITHEVPLALRLADTTSRNTKLSFASNHLQVSKSVNT